MHCDSDGWAKPNTGAGKHFYNSIIYYLQKKAAFVNDVVKQMLSLFSFNKIHTDFQKVFLSYCSESKVQTKQFLTAACTSES